MSDRTPDVDELREELLRNYQLVNVDPVYDQQGREAVINYGSYGKILKVLVNGALCAAKEIHYNIVVGPDSLYVRQFIRECELMSQMRHPNVVQFLGVHQPPAPTPTHSIHSPVHPYPYHPQESLPRLVMEFVPFELHSLLLRPIEIPMPVRASILLDIARGLSYLHNNHVSMEIIHRDLTARNVLLTSSLTAKLADFGVSKRPTADMTMTRDTGNILYMPPENKEGSKTRYNSKMDIFSFGVIMLFTVVKEFPDNILPPAYQASNGSLIARTEIARRQQYFDLVEGSVDPIVRRLVTLSKISLEYEPNRRPTAQDLTRELSELTQATELDKLKVMHRLHGGEEEEALRQNVEDEVTGLHAQVDELRFQLENRAREVTAAQRETSELREQHSAAERDFQRSSQELNGRLRALQDELLQANEEKAQLRGELETKEWELREKERVVIREREIADHYRKIIDMGESEEMTDRQEIQRVRMLLDESERARANIQHHCDNRLQEKDSTIAQLEETVASYERDLAQLQDTLKKKGEDYLSLKRRAIQFKEQADRLAAEKSQVSTEAKFPVLPPSGLKTTLTLSCSRQDPTPFGLHSAQCVRMENKVLFGGAMQAAESNQKKTILCYDQVNGRWSDIAHRKRLMNFTMVVINNKLFIVGGYDEARNEYSDVVYTYTDSEQWKEFFRLPSKRAQTAVFTYRGWLVVAGGCTDGAMPLDQVIALDCNATVQASGSLSQWKTLAPLPERIHDFQSASYSSFHHSDRAKDIAVVYLTSRRQGQNPGQPTMAASIPDLIFRGAQWIKIPDPPVRSPGVATLRGHLLALGGQDPKKTTVISNKVHMYNHGTREWLPVAEIASPRVMCSCVGLSESKFMVLGGKDKRNQYSTTVEVYNLPS